MVWSRTANTSTGTNLTVDLRIGVLSLPCRQNEASTTTGRGSSSDRAPTTSAQEADILCLALATVQLTCTRKSQSCFAGASDLSPARSAIPIQLKPDVVGPHAREQVRHLKAQPGQLIQECFSTHDFLACFACLQRT